MKLINIYSFCGIDAVVGVFEMGDGSIRAFNGVPLIDSTGEHDLLQERLDISVDDKRGR